MKRAIATAIALFLLTVVGLLSIRNGDRLRSKARKEWKENAIAGIGRRLADQGWLTNEIGTLQRVKTKEPSDSENWLFDNLILMTNREWIVYASICSKENWRIHDIFIGRGSDGKWYYSTYHFCVRMLVLKMEDQPESLLRFCQDYFVREFDGRSDECLNKTWPPERRQN